MILLMVMMTLMPRSAMVAVDAVGVHDDDYEEEEEEEREDEQEEQLQMEKEADVDDVSHTGLRDPRGCPTVGSFSENSRNLIYSTAIKIYTENTAVSQEANLSWMAAYGYYLYADPASDSSAQEPARRRGTLESYGICKHSARLSKKLSPAPSSIYLLPALQGDMNTAYSNLD